MDTQLERSGRQIGESARSSGVIDHFRIWHGLSALHPFDGDEIKAHRAAPAGQCPDLNVGLRSDLFATELQDVFAGIDGRHGYLVHESLFDPRDGGRGGEFKVLGHMIEVQRHCDVSAAVRMHPMLVAYALFINWCVQFDQRVVGAEDMRPAAYPASKPARRAAAIMSLPGASESTSTSSIRLPPSYWRKSCNLLMEQFLSNG